MATGVSSTHTSPLRPFCFPYSRAYRSCCSCSVPLTSRSTRALHRLEDQKTSYNTFCNINRYNSSIGFQHYSGKTSIDKKTHKWKLETDTCASKASMLQLYLDQRFSGGKLCTRMIVNQERIGVKGGKLPRNFRRATAVEVIKNYPRGRKGFSTAAHCSESLHGTAVAWRKEGENLAKQKKEHTSVGEMKFQRNGNQCAYPSEVKCTLKAEPFYQSQLTEKQACSKIVGRQHGAIKNYAASIQPQPSRGAQYLENVGLHVNTKNFDTESKGMTAGPRPLYNVNGQCLDGPCKADMLFINGQGEGAQARSSFMEEAIVKGENFEQIGGEVADLNKCQLDGRKTSNVIDNYDAFALTGTESKGMATGPRPLYNMNGHCPDGPCKKDMPFINWQGEGAQVLGSFTAESIVKGENFEQIGDEVADVNKCQLDDTESKGMARGPRPLYNVNGQCLDGPCKMDKPFINGQGEGAQARGSFRVESIVKGEKFEQIGDKVADVNKCQLDGGQITNVTDSHIKSSDKDEASVSQADLQKRLIKSSDKDEASVSQEDLQKRLTSIYHDVLVVDSICKAKEVVGMLTSRYRHLVHACDTEVANIDVRQETPVDHGEVICFSIYSGPEADFGNGKSCIWVDVLDGGGRALFLEFAPFFEDPSIRKVWHNYSFDNHVIENYGLKLSGFHADTMHMARLWDSSRRLEGGYSLEALTGDKRVMSSAVDKKTKPGSSEKESAFKSHNQRTVSKAIWVEGGYSLETLTGDKRVMSSTRDKKTKPGSSEKESTFEARNQRAFSEVNSQNIMPDAGSFHEDLLGKISMKTIFGRRKVKKDGLEGKMITIAPVEELQREERELWICYSALDAKSTLKLYESLRGKLLKMPWKLDGEPVLGKTMFDFYLEYWQPFGRLLVEMETEGMLVDRDYLAHIEKVAKTEQEVAVNRFREWASSYCPDAKYMNVGSDTQLRQLLFGGTKNGETDDGLPDAKEFKVPNVDNVVEEGKKAPKKYRTIKLRRIVSGLSTDIYTLSGWPSVSGVALKTLVGKLAAKVDLNVDDLLLEDEIIETLDGEESCFSTVANENDDEAVFKAFECENETKEACLAIASLCEICSIDSLISNFILPLQGSNISGESGRVHCSLNINTETGRLSARRPNLQNQPALEKDRYKIRQAFVAAPGNSLIVADYGQLELRILAHLANCKSMLHAFEAGGDFHSRTAMNMYSHIREAVQKREVLLEWYPQPGEERPPVPLLKDAFASERRKAKMLNFSIAYGKTPVGLSRDWKVSVNEAKKTVDLWYKERQEVLQWQEARKREALDTRYVHTLLGRARKFPSVGHGNRSTRGHIERAAINTPVQGSAADVTMCAMLEISKNLRLKELGWRLLLQVHDEVILEGPTETAEVAKEIVVECMSKPFDGKNFLRVGLSVDAKCAQNWYAGK